MRSGTALRFTLTVFADADKTIGLATAGFLAFRQADGGLSISPPVTWLSLRGKPIKYSGTSLTPAASDAVKAYIEAEWGAKLRSDADWNSLRRKRMDSDGNTGWRLE